MHWNHRIVQVTEMGEAVLVVAEVFYNDAGEPYLYGEANVVGDSIDEIHEAVARFATAAKQPILVYPTDFTGKPDYDEEVPVTPV